MQGKYCNTCGQKQLNNDRSLSHLVGDLVNNLFFVDNRLWVSIKYLLFEPGRMTYEYLSGKRRKFMPPVTIFLFVNVIYFFTSPLTDYSLPLTDQVKQPTHGSLATHLVEQKLKDSKISMEEYERTYNRASDNVSKTVMILNVPLISFFVYLLAIKKRKFYYDSLIYSMHFFSVFLLCIVIGVATVPFFKWSMNIIGITVNPWIYFYFFLFILPVFYAIISFQNFAKVKWYHSIWSGILIMISGALVQFVYRSIVFFITFWIA